MTEFVGDAVAASRRHWIEGALDQRIAFVGTSGSGKTYAAKGLAEGVLASQARLCVVDPLGVWWGLRAAEDGQGPGFPVIVFGGRHADIPLTEDMGSRLAGLVARQPLSCVVDLSELGSGAARRRFMTAFTERLFEDNTGPLHLVLDEADMWAPQQARPESRVLLGHVEEIVRRGRVRGFIPWLISQRPAVLHKDVLSQADILIAMKLTSSQDRDAIGGWITGQADRAEGKRILAELPRLPRGDGYVWAPADGVLQRVTFPSIRSFDSSRTPGGGELVQTPAQFAAVDVPAIRALLGDGPAPAKATAQPAPRRADDEARIRLLEEDLVAAQQRARVAERQVARLLQALTVLTSEASAVMADMREHMGAHAPATETQPPAPAPRETSQQAVARPGALRAKDAPASLGPAARKLFAVFAERRPALMTWRQAATLAGLKPSGGHYNAGRKQLRDDRLVQEDGDLVALSADCPRQQSRSWSERCGAHYEGLSGAE